MYVISPTYTVDTYRSNNDFYRISAVQRASRNQPVKARLPEEYTFEQTPHRQYVRAAASGIAELLNSAQAVKQSAQALLTGGAAAALNQRLDEHPARDLFQSGGRALRSYGYYQYQLQPYLPVPMNGLLLDRVM